MNLKDKLTTEKTDNRPLTAVIKGMTDGDIEKILQTLIDEVDLLQKRVTALEKSGIIK